MNLDRYRNIGICAHIDAGKTTLTERILYYTGKKHYIGEVHSGNTTMDCMDQERERGITICSAVVTVLWSGTFNNYIPYKINIIDTPGHIDFTAEVERSLRILDSVCLTFCSVGGIQPQTEQIWWQIKKYLIPTIGFINKMDRPGSNHLNVIKQINDQLNIKPMLIQYPLIDNDKFIGLIDLITLNIYKYNNNDGSKVIITKCKPNPSIIKARSNLIEELIEPYNLYIDKYLNNNITINDIKSIIRKRTILCEIMPILCGTALKNKGIQNLLDSIVDYLPSPLDINQDKIDKLLVTNKDSFTGLIFKLVNDEYTGLLSFIRIYTGIIKVGDIILNTRTNLTEKIVKIYEIYADKRISIDKASSGDIIALVGLKNSITGDTLCSIDSPITLKPIKFPQPVISISIKPTKQSNCNKLYSTIKTLALEDPTISFYIDSEDGCGIISGMGELHIEVFIERVKRLVNTDFNIKEPSIRYRETIKKSVTNIEGKYIKQSGGRGHYGHIIVNATPININESNLIVNNIKGGVIPLEYIKVIINSLNYYCLKGFITSGLVVGIKFEIIGGSFHEVDSNEHSFKLATYNLLKNIFKYAGVSILEPVMTVSIISKNNYLGILLSDLSSRRGEIVSTQIVDANILYITANVPLSELFNYSTILRSITAGRSTFNLVFNKYSITNIYKSKC